MQGIYPVKSGLATLFGRAARCVGGTVYGHEMDRQTWRIDPIGPGHIAWLYVIPHACEWSGIAAVAEAEYEVTEEAQ
jgi:hypothetical protein